VYDIIRRFTSDELTLAASLLHDCVEDYRKHDVKKGIITKETARIEAQGEIEKLARGREIFSVVDELTNPLEYRDAASQPISKEQWQSEHASHMSIIARIIKIADQAANNISTVEENPDWDMKKRLDYVKKASSVVKGAQQNLSMADPAYPVIKKLAQFSEFVEKGTRNVTEGPNKRLMSLPQIDQPKAPGAFNIDTLDELVRLFTSQSIRGI